MTPLPRAPSLTCDIFCRVVDNYGDIGVAWRLAHQLAGEHGARIRLIVDDIASFRKLVPRVVPDSPEQSLYGVTVIAWRDPLALSNTADLVIEAFACKLPGDYLAQMARRASPPVWINVEYLSAEAWVEEHHLLPSPHPSLQLTKFYFFPGFTAGTGGLLREHDLISRLDSIATPGYIDKIRVLVFSYDHAPLEALCTAMAQSEHPVVCRVSESGLAESLKHWRASQAEIVPGAAPMLEIEVVPFVPQTDFDSLLWQHDILFVRGEDSFVRAQWSAKPFVWHIYSQAENAHMLKLNAFLDLYCEGLPIEADTAVRDLWHAWNVPAAEAVGPAWVAFVAQLPTLNGHARRWAQRLAEMPDLACSLLSFYRKKAKIQGFAAS